MANAKPKMSPEKLPAELVEKITTHLDLASTRELRLTSRTFSQISAGPHFRSYLENQTTDLSQASLDNLRELAAHEQLGPAVKNLKIMSTTHDTSLLEGILRKKSRQVVEHNGPIFSSTEVKLTEEELAKTQADLDWMQGEAEKRSQMDDQSVIDMLAGALKDFAMLKSIDLDARVFSGQDTQTSPAGTRDWHAVWVRASHVFRLVMSAIARSGVDLDTLTVYRSTPRCSVPSIEVATHLPKLESEPNFAAAAASIKNLTLSLSTRAKTEFGRPGMPEVDFFNRVQYGSKAPQANVEGNFTGIADLLKHMPNLEAIELHLYNTFKGPATKYVDIFTQIAEKVSLSHLEQVFLVGMPATEDSMLQFLQKHDQIKDLSLRSVRLMSGSWDPVFKHLGQMTAITSVHASTLWGPGLVNLMLVTDNEKEIAETYRPQLRSLPYSASELVHTRDFDVADLRNGIEFRETRGARLDSWHAYQWLEKQRFLLGPP